MAKVHTLVLDAGPLITLTREELFGKAESLVTTPQVVREIKDEAARQRLELWKSELQVKQPSKDAISFVTEFAKKTGDALVLSSQDIEIIALAYDLHPDKASLRQAPKIGEAAKHEPPKIETLNIQNSEEPVNEEPTKEEEDDGFEVVVRKPRNRRNNWSQPKPPVPAPAPAKEDTETEEIQESEPEEDDSDWSDDGWITNDNLELKLNNDNNDTVPIVEPVSVALASRDFAVQNVALQIGIGAVNERGLAIKQLRSYMQRCHACFKLLPLPADAGKREFCPRCGGHTLTRVTVSVTQDGVLRVHLKANMQWKTRGDRYTLQNPQSRKARQTQRANQGAELYAEDQPEFMKAKKLQERQERRNRKMVENYIGPSTVDSAVSPFMGKREMTSQVRIGRGRHANSKKH